MSYPEESLYWKGRGMDSSQSEPVVSSPPGLKERLAAKLSVDPDTGCHNWTGARTPFGYGHISEVVDGKHLTRRVHRVAYEVAKGPIPAGMVVDHLCRNRACCNPAHLEAVTTKTNNERSPCRSTINAAKTHCPQGHAYDAENTAIGANGARMCRQCRREREKARQKRIRRAAATDRVARLVEAVNDLLGLIRQLYT